MNAQYANPRKVRHTPSLNGMRKIEKVEVGHALMWCEFCGCPTTHMDEHLRTVCTRRPR